MNAHEGPIDVHLDRLIELVRDLLGKTREHAAAGGEHEPAKVAPVTIPREVAESPAGGSASGRERVTMLVAAISAVVLLGVLILLLAGGNNEQDDGTGVNATVAASNPNRNANAADTPQVDTSDWETGGDLWGDDAPDAEPPAHPPERLTPDAATPAPAGAADGWIDLIPQINTTEHALSGSWSKGGDGVRVDATAVGPAVLALPYQPVGNYEYRLRFTRHAGEDSLAQIFTLGQGRANFEMDCWGERLGGVQQIDDVDVRGNATRLNNINLSTDATYTMSLRVTGSSFVGRVAGPDIDETVRYDSPSNGDELSAPPIWGIDDSLRLGIGVYNSIFVIHEIAVRPLP